MKLNNKDDGWFYKKSCAIKNWAEKIEKHEPMVAKMSQVLVIWL